MSLLWLLIAPIWAKELGPLLASSRFAETLDALQEMHTQNAVSASVKDEVRAFAKQLRDNCDKLMLFTTKTYEGFAVEGPKVASAIQWAQNRTHVLGQIKFAHRWTSPGALEVSDPVIEIRGGHFYFEGVGQHSGAKKRYVFEAPLYATVEPPPDSTWSLGSVGRLALTLRKVESEKWPRLTKEKKTAHQITSWVHMQEKCDAEDGGKKKDKPEKVKKTENVEGKKARAARARWALYMKYAKYICGILLAVFLLGRLLQRLRVAKSEATARKRSVKSRLLDREGPSHRNEPKEPQGDSGSVTASTEKIEGELKER